MSEPLLDVRDLRISFRDHDARSVEVVQGLDLTLEPGKALAIVGESGSGKSVSMRALLGLLPANAKIHGSVRFGGRDLLRLTEREMRSVRGRKIGMVFQNAATAMNPTQTLERQLTEHLIWHRVCDRAEAKARALRALGDAGIPEPERRIKMYPFQLSGGMLQRALIATAMVARPDILIADEATTAVDALVQRQILDLLQRVKETGTALIMITHDLGVARYVCDDVLVMYAGAVMERAPVQRFLSSPLHPYSIGLIESALEIGSSNPLRPISGQPPHPSHRPAGCPFHPRCPLAELPRCTEEQALISVNRDHDVRCWKTTASQKAIQLGAQTAR